MWVIRQKRKRHVGDKMLGYASEAQNVGDKTLGYAPEAQGAVCRACVPPSEIVDIRDEEIPDVERDWGMLKNHRRALRVVPVFFGDGGIIDGGKRYQTFREIGSRN